MQIHARLYDPNLAVLKTIHNQSMFNINKAGCLSLSLQVSR